MSLLTILRENVASASVSVSLNLERLIDGKGVGTVLLSGMPKYWRVSVTYLATSRLINSLIC